MNLAIVDIYFIILQQLSILNLCLKRLKRCNLFRPFNPCFLN
ncbi:hypothetical protein LSO2F_280014 [Candidatus Liberibacter solanacearum]